MKYQQMLGTDACKATRGTSMAFDRIIMRVVNHACR